MMGFTLLKTPQSSVLSLVHFQVWCRADCNQHPSCQTDPLQGHSACVTYLALGVSLDLPPSWQLQLSVRKLVEEHHQVPVMLVALKVPGVATHFQDHVFHTAAACEHPVGRLESKHGQVHFYINKIS